MEAMTVRAYAAREGISIGAAYRRVWEGRVTAKQLYGRWLITPESDVASSGIPAAVIEEK